MLSGTRIIVEKAALLLIFVSLLCPIFGRAVAIEIVAIDPGHGGEDWGCIGVQGTREKDVTLEIARQLSEIIQDRMGAEAVLTRTNDSYIGLFERTGIANHNKAEILISLHANSAFSDGQTGQVMIFFVHGQTSDVKDERDIGAGNFIDTKDKEEAKAILWDMVQTRLHNESYRLANIIAEESRKSGLWRDSVIKQAPVLVLKGANMPAVEIEMDFLTSPQGEERLMDQWHQQRICEVFYRAIIRFGYEFEGDPNGTEW